MDQNSKTSIFVSKAQKVHGNKYDYSLVDYLTADKHIKIVCKKHGIFTQTPNSHLAGCGCKSCFNDKRTLTFDRFLKTCLLIHGEVYDYSKTVFRTTKDKAIFICKIHGEFIQKVGSHLQGNGCKKCQVKDQTSSAEDFINKANAIHNFEYDYSHLNYKNNHIKIKIICFKHGDFMQSPRDHLSGRGCPDCRLEKIGNAHRMSLVEFVSRASIVHENFYDYSCVIYKNNATKIKIICPEHGDFEQKPLHHLNGTECPLCAHKNISKLEIKWLDSKNIAKENRNKTIMVDNKKYKVDGYDPATNTIYEFYGDYWHGNPNLSKYASHKINKVVKETFGDLYLKTINRENILRKAGYNIITIWEHDWIKENKG